MRDRIRTLATGLAALLVAACGDAPIDGPPPLRLGRDACAHCGMLLAEDRCAAASIVVTDGERAYLHWDDIGCLLDWDREHPHASVVSRFVRDYETRSWVEAPSASYLMTEAIRTPMGSWLVAFADRSRADDARAAQGGTVCSWAELADARVRWLVDEGRMPAPER